MQLLYRMPHHHQSIDKKTPIYLDIQEIPKHTETDNNDPLLNEDHNDKYAFELINKKNILISITISFIVLLLMIWVFYYLGDYSFKDIGKKLFHIGPSTKIAPIDIFGIKINSWKKWGILMIFLLIMRITETFSNKIYTTWYYQYVMNPRVKKIGMKKKEAYFIINIWNIFYWFNKLFYYLLLIITKQVQFLIPTLIGRDLISANIINKLLIKRKIG